jgi:hypothetical protein
MEMWSRRCEHAATPVLLTGDAATSRSVASGMFSWRAAGDVPGEVLAGREPGGMMVRDPWPDEGHEDSSRPRRLT